MSDPAERVTEAREIELLAHSHGARREEAAEINSLHHVARERRGEDHALFTLSLDQRRLTELVE